jgi:hypothetical protein
MKGELLKVENFNKNRLINFDKNTLYKVIYQNAIDNSK